MNCLIQITYKQNPRDQIIKEHAETKNNPGNKTFDINEPN